MLCDLYILFRVNVGLFCSTPGVALGRAVPRKLAMEMLFTGHPISAHGKDIVTKVYVLWGNRPSGEVLIWPIH